MSISPTSLITPNEYTKRVQYQDPEAMHDLLANLPGWILIVLTALTLIEFLPKHNRNSSAASAE